jgi:hypothetical protein
MKKTISERALFERIKRRLRAEGECLRKCRQGSRCFNDLGSYYSISIAHNAVRDTHIDLEAWGRHLGVLKSNEVLAAD